MKTLSSLAKALLVALIVNIAVSCCAVDAASKSPVKLKKKEQKEHLFKMSYPAGWRWVEEPERVKILDPQTRNAILIHFTPTRMRTDEEMRELLAKGNKEFIERVVKPAGGTVIKDRKRRLGGVGARELVYLEPHVGFTNTMTYISLFSKDYGITIVFGGSDKKQVALMETSVETLQF